MDSLNKAQRSQVSLLVWNTHAMEDNSVIKTFIIGNFQIIPKFSTLD
jgi:hypothetical protein